jgi:hypothetical protein
MALAREIAENDPFGGKLLAVRFLAIVALPNLIFSAAFRHLSGLSARAVRRVTQQFISEVTFSLVAPWRPGRMLLRLRPANAETG